MAMVQRDVSDCLALFGFLVFAIFGDFGDFFWFLDLFTLV
jgi:hypothetical protein